MKNYNIGRFAVTALFLGASVLFTGCQKENVSTLTGQNDQILETRLGAGSAPIAQIAIDAGFSELVGALLYVDAELEAGLVNLFMNGTDQYTVFAPTNEAFQSLYSDLGVGGIDELDPALVLAVLKYHVVPGRRAANSVVPPNRPRQINTLLGVPFTVTSAGQIQAVGNTAGIVSPNISASNGIIHVINAVILPISI